MSALSSRADCPFCAIAVEYPPATPATLFPSEAPQTSSTSDTASTAPTLRTSKLAHILLSTPHLIAFLDHAPISRGHVLVATRSHWGKLGDVSVQDAMAIGKWLGVVSRAVMVGATQGQASETEGAHGTMEPGVGGQNDVGDWNVVQNNGARAAQVVPHVHFHIIPRNGDVPEVKARSWTVFGKGQREDLDEEDAEVLIGRMRKALVGEVERVRQREGEGAVRELLGHEVGGKSKL